ncbi:MAG: TonB-dependent receptor plug domain-containing protein [Bacteroidetes bacterium]|nr:TonB-dependent receptor plug domain-containing protein [Bacteroidota bacterium]
MKKFWLLCIVLILSEMGLSAQDFALSGIVRDAESGEVLVGAQVYDTKSKRETMTNNEGYYNLVVPAGHRIIEIYYTGYTMLSDTVYVGTSAEQDFGLLVNIYFEDDPVPSDDAPERQQSSTPDPLQIPSDQMRTMPPVFGEVDLIKNLQTMPGIQNGLEGSGGFYVRGGTPDQNLFLLDGVPVYNVYHAFGFFSSFNTQSINSMSLYKGGFPARFGSRLSSVTDLTLKDGSADQMHGSFSLGLVSFVANLEGPLSSSGKTTFSASFRRTIPPLLYALNPLATHSANEQSGAYFYDASLKVAHQISDKEKITFSFYRSKDKYYSKTTNQSASGTTRVEETFNNQLDWANTTGAIRYSRIHSPHLYAVYSVSYAEYIFNVRQDYSSTVQSDTGKQSTQYDLRYFTGIRDFTAKADYEYTRSYEHKIRFGFWETVHAFGTGVIEAKFHNQSSALDTILGPQSRKIGNELAAYVEDDIHVSDQVRMNAGMRLSTFLIGGKTYFAAEPRLSMRYMIDDKWAFKSSYAYNKQYLHMISNSGVGLPTDLWVPATPNIKPQSSQQVTAGFFRDSKDGMKFSVEGYYKWMNNVLDYAEGVSFASAQIDWEDRVKQGIGRAYGVEFLFQKKFGNVYGWLGYTLSWNKRKIDGINNDEWYYYRYDRRHQVNLMLGIPVNDRSSYSFNVVYGTGYPVTFPYGRYLDINGNQVFDYEKKNGYRLSYYLRFDVSYTGKRSLWGGDIQRELILSVYNLLNRNNPYYLYISTDPNTGKMQANQQSLLPFFPSFTYRLSF